MKTDLLNQFKDLSEKRTRILAAVAAIHILEGGPSQTAAETLRRSNLDPGQILAAKEKLASMMRGLERENDSFARAIRSKLGWLRSRGWFARFCRLFPRHSPDIDIVAGFYSTRKHLKSLSICRNQE